MIMELGHSISTFIASLDTWIDYVNLGGGRGKLGAMCLDIPDFL